LVENHPHDFTMKLNCFEPSDWQVVSFGLKERDSGAPIAEGVSL